MKRALIAAAVLSLAFAVPAFAVEGGQPPKDQAQSFEQKKADILKKIEARMARNQEEKSCVQAAKSHEDLKACWEKQKQEMEKMREDMGGRGGRGGLGGPGGQFPPQGR